MEQKKKHNRIRADLLLIAFLLLLGGGLFLLRRLSRTAGNVAAVYVDGVRVGAYPLAVDREIPIGEGGETNHLSIHDGAADMTDASCPDRLCVHMRPIRYVGETITCLPHRVLIQIEGAGEAEVDIP